VGVLAALQHTGGVWFGWSGEKNPAPPEVPETVTRGNIQFATIDLKPDEFDAYYNGYCNGTLWPLFHYFPERFTHEQRQFEAYQAVNEQFARQLLPLLRPDDVVWVHDYQLIPLGRCLRQLNFTGSVGFFLHIPFPHVQILRLLPDYAGLVRDLCQYDLVGFQTADDVRSFLTCLDPPVEQLPHNGWLALGGRRVRVGAYPIGIDVDSVIREANTTTPQEPVQRMIHSLMGRKLIMGVDRLDYTKGLAARFAAFEQFLLDYPDNLSRVTLLQIAPLSREDITAYSEIREALEQRAGRINGHFAQADWTPIRYLNRDFSHATLMGFLRAAQVAMVTPIRDGMNLVAKEYVAAQDPQDPGVLLLSPMAGAAGELTGALQINPYDKNGLAQALQTALTMPLAERLQRYAQMMSAIRGNDIHTWYGNFVYDLTGERLPRPSVVESDAVRPIDAPVKRRAH
jgi:trehalose 6-phosphate synthase